MDNKRKKQFETSDTSFRLINHRKFKIRIKPTKGISEKERRKKLWEVYDLLFSTFSVAIDGQRLGRSTVKNADL